MFDKEEGIAPGTERAEQIAGHCSNAVATSPGSTELRSEDVVRIIEKHDGSRGSLIAILEDIQAAYNYLPREALELVARETGESLVDIYGVATFFRTFSLEPKGDHIVRVCMGTACHVRGAPRVLDAFERELGVDAGCTTEDREFTLETVNCLGACALGPVAVLDGEYNRNVSSSQVPKIVRYCRSGDQERMVSQAERTIPVEVSCPHCNRSLMMHEHLIDGQPSIHVTVSFEREHGWLRLSSLYGSHNLESEHEIPHDTVPHFFCPRCHAELRSTKPCVRCEAPMIPLFVQRGGIIHFCSRQGCKEHMLDLSSG